MQFDGFRSPPSTEDLCPSPQDTHTGDVSSKGVDVIIPDAKDDEIVSLSKVRFTTLKLINNFLNRFSQRRKTVMKISVLAAVALERY